MKSASVIAAASLLWLAVTAPASAYVEFGRPDYSNYIAPYGWGTCDWWTSAWLHACPGVLATPAAAPAAAEPAIVKAKKGGAAKKSAK